MILRFKNGESVVRRCYRFYGNGLPLTFCNFFTAKHYRSGCQSRWENLDRGQYPFQPIKFMNLVVPSPCETEPYNKEVYKSLHGITEEYKRLHGITGVYRGLHGCTRDYRGIQGITGVYRGSQRYT